MITTNQFKKKFVIILLIFILSSSSVSAYISMSVSAGFDNNVVTEGNIIPYQITLDSNINNFDGYLLLTVYYNVDQSYQSVRKDITLSGSSVKKFFLYAAGLHYFSVRLYDKKNNLYAESVSTDRLALTEDFKRITVNTLGGYNNLFMLTIDNEGRGIDFSFKNARQNSGKQGIHINNAVINPQNLPDHFSAYQSVDCIILRSIKQKEIETYFNKSRILDWVRMGGNLLITLSDNYRELQNIEWKLPVETSGVEKLDIRGLLDDFEDSEALPESMENVTGVPFKIKNSFEPIFYLRKKSDNLLYSEIKYGMGKICFFSPDLQNSAIKNYFEKNELFIDRLTADGGFVQKFGRRNDPEMNLTKNLKAYSPGDMPGPFTVLFFIIIFIIAILPFNLFILKKKKKEIYLWVTIPVISILFSIFALGWVKAYSINKIFRYNYALTTFNSGDDYAVAAEFCFFSSPEKNNFNIEVDGRHSLAKLNDDYRYRNNDDFLQLNQSANKNIIENFFITIKGSKGFISESVEKNEGTVRAEYSLVDQKLDLSISNAMPVHLKRCFVFSGNNDEFYLIGDIKAGENKKLSTLLKSSSNDLQEFILGKQAYQEILFNVRAEKDVSIQMMNHLRTVFYNSFFYNPNSGSNNLILPPNKSKKFNYNFYSNISMFQGLYNKSFNSPVLVGFSDFVDKKIKINKSGLNEIAVNEKMFIIFMEEKKDFAH